VQHRRDADRLTHLAQAGPRLGHEFGPQIAVLGGARGGATRHHHQDVVLDEFAHDAHDPRIMGHPGVVAAHDARQAADAAGHDDNVSGSGVKGDLRIGP